MKPFLSTLSIFVIAALFFTNKLNAQSNQSSPSLLKHIVIITFKKDANADSIKALDEVYNDLAKSPLVKGFESGVDISSRNSGLLKHVYITTFTSEEDKMNYSKIPDHARLFKISLPIADDVTVVDYWVNK